MSAKKIEEMSVGELAGRFYRNFNEYAADLFPEVNYSSAYCRRLAEMALEVRRLAHEKGELLLAHYYQRPEVQEVADFVGDSLGLGLEAKKILELSPDELQKKLGRTKSITRVRMSAVRFMGDTVKIILGDKISVFMPKFSGCSLVASLNNIPFDYRYHSEQETSIKLLEKRRDRHPVDAWLKENPGGIVLSYM